jgi:5-formyltetrahydrofolate cyclo-ligase
MSRRALRAAARAARDAFVGGVAPAVRRALETALAEALRPMVRSAGVIGGYAARGSEVDPFPVEAMVPGRLAFPRVTTSGLRFHRASFDGLSPGFRGIPEPLADAPTVEPDLLLVPLLQFDASGNRLGQGGGHYDRALRRLRAERAVTAIGLAWDMQEADRIAPEPWDEPLDAVATPTRLLRFGPHARGGG